MDLIAKAAEKTFQFLVGQVEKADSSLTPQQAVAKAASTPDGRDAYARMIFGAALDEKAARAEPVTKALVDGLKSEVQAIAKAERTLELSLTEEQAFALALRRPAGREFYAAHRELHRGN